MMVYKEKTRIPLWLIVLVLVVLAYFFPNLPQQVFRVVIGGAENVISGAKQVAKEEFDQISNQQQFDLPDFPTVVSEKYGDCSDGLMTKYDQTLWIKVLKPGGITVTNGSGLFAQKITVLQEGTPIHITNTGVCKNGAAWWPIEWQENAHMKSGWAMGGK